MTVKVSGNLSQISEWTQPVRTWTEPVGRGHYTIGGDGLTRVDRVVCREYRFHCSICKLSWFQATRDTLDVPRAHHPFVSHCPLGLI